MVNIIPLLGLRVVMCFLAIRTHLSRFRSIVKAKSNSLKSIDKSHVNKL